nr:hypothetical protein [Treponema sp.]
MKKILVLFVVFCFAQTIFCASNVVANKNQVQVTETNWGYEISNIENVEKFIFRNKAKSNAEIYIILGKENEFLDESEAIKFIKLLKQKDDGTNFYQPFHYY